MVTGNACKPKILTKEIFSLTNVGLCDCYCISNLLLFKNV